MNLHDLEKKLAKLEEDAWNDTRPVGVASETFNYGGGYFVTIACRKVPVRRNRRAVVQTHWCLDGYRTSLRRIKETLTP